MLGGRTHGKSLETVPLAKPGSNAEEQYWRLFKELTLRPPKEGIVFLYVGINETTPEPKPSALQRLAAQSLLISRASYWVNNGKGRRSLDYENRLAKLLTLARRHHLPVIISTLAGNIRGFRPAASPRVRSDPTTSQTYAVARREESLGHTQAAAKIYAALLSLAGPDPGLLHPLAVHYLKSNRLADARALFVASHDTGTTLRPTREQNQAIRRMAARHGAALTDTKALFESASPAALPGNDLFRDAHHPNLRGYLLVAGGLARQMSRMLNIPILSPNLSEADLRTRLGYTSEDERSSAFKSFIWFCGEANIHADKEEALRMARRYLELGERTTGRPAPLYRLILALVAGNHATISRLLAHEETLLQDTEALRFVAGHREWTTWLVRRAGLSAPLEARAQRILDHAGEG
ncbi:MAG: hypothetical protein A3J79_10985 [Elusimicrobia bacterium RIFOXYB2_FULL_62_6]|nr:MAG: hypothetical protein A3J79_10985 [Elusimicrobia bacterium RIFOXYB2_FULL_62_6]